MTKKHFIAIAAAIKAQKDKLCARGDSALHAQLREVANVICNIAEKDNPHFEPRRFLAACGF